MALNVKGLEGNEIVGDYSRKTAQRGRWGESWDAFKASFWKVVVINIFMLITFAPGIFLMFFRQVYLTNMGAAAPFNANTGIGYPANPNTVGMTEQITLSVNVMFYPALLLAGFFAAVGLAGGAYSIRKIITTHGQFNIKNFFYGIKVNYFNTLLPITVFMVFLIGTMLIGDWKDLVLATGGNGAGAITAYVFAIIVTVIGGIYCAWLFAVGVNYKVTFAQLFKNAFVLIIGSPIQTVFFAGFSLIPVWLYLIGGVSQIIRVISYIFFIFLGFSFVLLVWLSFTQWVFDLYITPNIKAEEAAKSGKTVQKSAEERAQDEKRVAMELLASGRSELLSKPILPIAEGAAVSALGKTFSRSDMAKVQAEKDKLKSDIAEYEKQHENDPEYKEYKKLFAEREKALEVKDKKQKKKKLNANNLLKG